MSQLIKSIYVVFGISLLSGCATLQFDDFFVGYADQTAPVRNAVMAHDFAKAKQLLGSKSQSHTSYTLNLLERGRVAHLAGQYEQSLMLFEQAYQQIEEDSAKASIRVSQGIEKLGALVSNDSAIVYQVPAYEQSMMHSYQALNYLYVGKLESALVEIRRANLVQEQALKDNADEIDQAEQALSGSGRVNWQQANAAFSSLNTRIGRVKNGVQNAYTFYLSGVLYEAAGQQNDAYIDYKKALEIFPENTYLQQDVIRLAHALGMKDDLTILQKRFDEQPAKIGATGGDLVIIFEQGLIDSRVEQTTNLPIFTRHNDFRTFGFSLPSYHANVAAKTPLELNVNGQQHSSEQIVQLQALVAKQLQEQMPSIIARQTLRIIAKEQVRRNLQKEGGDIGNILAGLYNMASERADTRSWLTLPSDVQVLRTTMPLGKSNITLRGVTGLSDIPVEIKDGRITLLFINQLGVHSQYNVVNL